jgi:hypothetical protein
MDRAFQAFLVFTWSFNEQIKRWASGQRTGQSSILGYHFHCGGVNQLKARENFVQHLFAQPQHLQAFGKGFDGCQNEGKGDLLICSNLMINEIKMNSCL